MFELPDDYQAPYRMKRIFISGISTDVGKTFAAAVVVEALHADYWKPVQAGDLENGDSQKVASLISNKHTVIHPCSYELNTPMSPHAAAQLDGVHIETNRIIEPETKNHLVIEGAGGLLVPLNESDTVLDLIKPDYKVVVVSRHYLGSINHSLLTIERLQNSGFKVHVLFNGRENRYTEDIITRLSGITVLGRINEEQVIDKECVKRYADSLRPSLLLL